MRVVPVLALLLAVGGCTSGGAEPAPQRTTAAPVVSVSPPYDKSKLPPLVLSAQVPPDGFRSIGGPATAFRDDTKAYATATWCGKIVEGDYTNSHTVHSREWSWNDNVVFNAVHGYVMVTGMDALEDVKEIAAACATFTAANGDQYRMGGPIELAKPDGVDAVYAMCAKFVRGGKTYSWCYAYIARGRLVAAVQVTSNRLNGEVAFLNQVVPLVAAALVAPAQ